MDSSVQVVGDSAELALVAAQRFALHARDAVAARGRFCVALSGGGTPMAMYRVLATLDPQSVPWSSVYFFWSDERHVAPDHPDSNYGAASEALLRRLPIAASQVKRIEAERPDAHKAAYAYELELRSFFGVPEGGLPRFDLVLLGLGADGHTASLFPGTAALDEQQGIVVANRIDTLATERITLTAHAINNAAHVLFLVSSAEKSAALHAVLEGPYQPARFPAQLIRPENGTLSWIVDADAARLLCAD